MNQNLDSRHLSCVMTRFATMKPKDDKQPAQADERNLVAVDPDFPDADADDKFYLFWEKNGVKVVVAFVVLSLGILTYQALGVFADYKDTQTISAYSAAVTADEKAQFATQYEGHRISGLAYLEAANLAFESEDFGRAVELYSKAEGALQPELAGRARIAKAFAQLQNEDREAAKNTLQAVSNDAGQSEASRAEASCHLAVLLWEDGDTESAKSVLETVQDLQNASVWGQKAQQLIGQIERS